MRTEVREKRNVHRSCDRTSKLKVQVVSCLPFRAEKRVQFQIGLLVFSGGQSGNGTGVSSSTSVFPCQYHSAIAPYSFIHLPPTLYNVFLPVLQFSPVSIIPPMLHTHPFIYHRRCILFFSQYFSFPLSVSFHHCSILIPASIADAVFVAIGVLKMRGEVLSRDIDGPDIDCRVIDNASEFISER